MAASPPVRLRWCDAPGSPEGQRLRALRVLPHGLMVGGGRPLAPCWALVLQDPYQVGQRLMPRRCRVPLRPVGRHAVLLAGPLPR